MDNWFSLILVGSFVVCYFIFGIPQANRIVNNRMGALCQDTKKIWLKYLLIALFALVLGYAYFFLYAIKAIIKLVQFIVSGRIGS